MRLLALVVLLSGSAFAQCTKDTDCKGDRVCSIGACVDSDVPRQVSVSPEVLRVRFEIDTLKAQRPGLAPPIVMLSVALAMTAVGIGLMSGDSGNAFGQGLFIVGLGWLVGGAFGLASSLWGRAQANVAIRDLEALIETSPRSR